MPVSESLELLSQREDLAPFGEHAFALLALEYRFGLSDIAAMASSLLTDGKHDKKCDVLYVGRDTRTAVVCQAYWSKKHKTNPPANKAADLHTAASWVLAPKDPAALGVELAAAREELLDAIENGEIDDLELWYCHNLSSFPDAVREVEQAAVAASSILRQELDVTGINVRGLEVTASRVDEWLRKTENRVVIHDSMPVPANEWLQESGDGWKGVYTTVPAAWLYTLYQKYTSEKLFSGNIRADMKPRKSAGDINNGIQNTVADKPQRLWAYNNGLTALVEKVYSRNGKLYIRGISIVNGAQTTGSIGRLPEHTDDLEQARLLIRFVESADPEVVRDISTYNNTQNEILPSDFRSSDPVQERLVEEFAASGAVEYWGPRRGGSGKGARRPKGLLDADLVAQALAAMHGAPDIAYHAKNEIWRENVTYSRFFADRTTAAHVVFAVGLVRAVRRYKLDLRAMDARTALQDKVFSFLSHRGSDFLLTWAIGRCIEEILERAVADTWDLDFGSIASLEAAEEYWLPVVRALANFVDQLMPAAKSGDLRNSERVDTATSEFQSRVATSREGIKALDDFAVLVAT